MVTEYICTVKSFHLGRLWKLGERARFDDTTAPRDNKGNIVHFIRADGLPLTEPVMVPAEAPVPDGPTKKEIMAKLDEAKIKYSVLSNKAELSALLPK